jgi:hypothetical protein
MRAALHRHPNPYDEEVPVLAQQAVAYFERFLTLTDYPCEPVRIPYENGLTLPGYWCPARDVEGPAPTVIFNEGKDGWAQDGKYVVDEAIVRGYNALLWDGPGMGACIRLQGLPFRHDWEKVVTPLIDWLETKEEVDPDNIALISVSLGGYLGPRAAVFEHRLKALVPNPGVMSWYKVYEDFMNQLDPNLIPLFESDPQAFDETMLQLVNMSDFLAWGFLDSQWHHNVTTPSELLFELQRFTIEGMAQNIKAATLVVDAEEEERGQAMELYEALTGASRRDYIYFTSEEAAQFHDQPGATAILSERTFNFLDEVLTSDDNGSAGSQAGLALGGIAVLGFFLFFL